MGEIASCLEHLKPFLADKTVLNVGFGGSTCCAHEISMDRAPGHPERRVEAGADAPTHVWGDARNLYWFRDNVLDVVVSSHVLEDFTEQETVPVLKEWLRVIKPSGHLCLFLPDQQRYLAHAKRYNYQPNMAHKIAHFGMQYVKRCLAQFPVEFVLEIDPYPNNEYSFLLVAQKTRSL